ncbi:MAG: BCCT family transporter [Brevinema sp.]
MNTQQQKENITLYKDMFFYSVGVITIASTLIIMFPDDATNILNIVNKALLNNMGWFYLVVTLGMTLLVFWLGFGKYSHVRLGGADAKPEYSMLSWVGMILSCSTGSSLLYFGIIEWGFYYDMPITPWRIPGGTWEAAEQSIAYAFFHNGIFPWALVAIGAIIVGYFYHIKQLPFLRISSILGPLLGRHTDRFWGKVIDIFFVYSVLGGVATSLGISTRVLSFVAAELFGVANNFGLEAIILGVRAFVVFVVVILGLDKGIKKAADINMILMYSFFLFVFLTGPWGFIMNNITTAVGYNLHNFFRWSLWTDTISQSGFVQDWTMFYWAWWILYAVISGVFVAKISKGRTFREIVLGVVGGGTTCIWIMYGVMSGYSMNLQFTGILNVSELMKIAPETAAIEVIKTLPFGTICVFIFGIMMFSYSLGTLNSFSYTLASATTTKLENHQTPTKSNRAFWALFINFLGAAMMYLGTLESLKIASIITAFPMFIISIFMVISFFKCLKRDHINNINDKDIIIDSDYKFYRPGFDPLEETDHIQ